MADENPLSGILSSGEEEAAGETDAQPGGLDAAAAALAMEVSRTDPKLAAQAAAYFEAQLRLVKIQTEHLHEQRALTLSHLRLRRVSDRVRVATQMGFGLLLAASLAVISDLALNAAHSNNVVVDALAVPPSLAEHGVTGQVAADDLVDELRHIQTATRTDIQQRGVADAWSQDIRIDIPGSGISLADADRALRALLGSETHIRGAVTDLKDGSIALTVRGEDLPAHVFSGPPTDLPGLARRAAEYIYGLSEPAAFSTYLLQSRRVAEALDFTAAAFYAAREGDRPRLEWQWGNALEDLGRPDDAVPKLEDALRAEPHLWFAWRDLALSSAVTGGYEALLGVYHRMHMAARAAPANDQPRGIVLEGELIATADYTRLVGMYLEYYRETHGGFLRYTIEPAIAGAAARLHDWPTVAYWLARTPTDNAAASVIAGFADGQRMLPEQPAAAAAAFAKVESETAGIRNITFSLRDAPCFLALATARAGRLSEAHAALARGWNFGQCPALRADALEALGDHSGADSAYLDAIRISPSTPFAYEHRGRTRMVRGDYSGAVDDFRQANTRGPHWADPLKDWGDLLAAQGKWREALAKYDAAVTLAPAWDALKQARATAALKNQS